MSSAAYKKFQKLNASQRRRVLNACVEISNQEMEAASDSVVTLNGGYFRQAEIEQAIETLIDNGSTTQEPDMTVTSARTLSAYEIEANFTAPADLRKRLGLAKGAEIDITSLPTEDCTSFGIYILVYKADSERRIADVRFELRFEAEFDGDVDDEGRPFGITTWRTELVIEPAEFKKLAAHAPLVDFFSDLGQTPEDFLCALEAEGIELP